MGDETRPPLFPARSSSMFLLYMVFADILAQQTTNSQNQVLGITETKSRLIGRGFICVPENHLTRKTGIDNKPKVFPERMKQAGDTMEYIASPNLVLEAQFIWVRRPSSYDQAYLESRLTSKGYQDLSVFSAQRYAPFAALRQQPDARSMCRRRILKGAFFGFGQHRSDYAANLLMPCCFLHLLPTSTAVAWSSFLPAWPGGRRRRSPGGSRLI